MRQCLAALCVRVKADSLKSSRSSSRKSTTASRASSTRRRSTRSSELGRAPGPFPASRGLCVVAPLFFRLSSVAITWPSAFQRGPEADEGEQGLQPV